MYVKMHCKAEIVHCSSLITVALRKLRMCAILCSKKEDDGMMNILAVGLGGFAGAALRYLIGQVPVNEMMAFPIKTFLINIIGCIAIGTIAVTAAKNGSLSPHMILFLKVGLCGGFTTFSTFALETSDLIRSGNWAMALIYVLGSVLIGTGTILAIEYMSMK